MRSLFPIFACPALSSSALAIVATFSMPVSAEETPGARVAEAAFEPPRGAITLRDTVGAALLNSPALAVFSREIRAREARALQAGLRPNPELRTTVEDVAGSGGHRAFTGAETTVWLAQLVELGGKRVKRRSVAQLERDLAGWDYESQRANVLAETTKAFVATVAAQEQLALAEELLRLASRSVSAVDRQVKAGASSPVEATRAQVALGQAQVERALRARELEAARFALAASWGSTTPTFTRVVGDLAPIPAPPPMEALVARVAGNPDLARWATDLAARRAAVQLEEARRIPNVSIGAGPRYYSDTDDAALVFEFGASSALRSKPRRDSGGAGAARKECDGANRGGCLDPAALGARTSGSSERSTRSDAPGDHHPRCGGSLQRVSGRLPEGVLRYLEVPDTQRTFFSSAPSTFRSSRPTTRQSPTWSASRARRSSTATSKRETVICDCDQTPLGSRFLRSGPSNPGLPQHGEHVRGRGAP
jgi:cobalt-zinc-cadmium efflux system outer membrane protein